MKQSTTVVVIVAAIAVLIAFAGVYHAPICDPMEPYLKRLEEKRITVINISIKDKIIEDLKATQIIYEQFYVSFESFFQEPWLCVYRDGDKLYRIVYTDGPPCIVIVTVYYWQKAS